MTTVTIQPTVEQPPEDLILTCLRCQYVWMRRNLNKLPKTCPKCRSSYWQSPLTPYWEAYRRKVNPQEMEAAKQLEAQQKAAAKQLEAKNLKAAQQRIQLLLKGQLNQATNLILYTCPHQAALEIIKFRCNFWLPENMSQQPSLTQLCQVGNTIASTSLRLPNIIRDLIAKEQLPNKNVFWINIEGTQQYIYTFTKDGITQTCYKTTWPPAKEDL